jgi:hypothetical protein
LKEWGWYRKEPAKMEEVEKGEEELRGTERGEEEARELRFGTGIATGGRKRTRDVDEVAEWLGARR